jgi:ABC-type Na+ efflux pump permease subunit
MDYEKYKKIAYIVIPLLCILLGAGIGWKFKPDVVKTEIKEKIVYTEVAKTDTKEEVKKDTTKDIDTKVNVVIHKETKTEKKPDGTVTVTVVEDKRNDTAKVEKQVEVQIKTVEVIKEVAVTKEVIKEVKITPVLAQWHVGLLAGVAPRLDVPLQSAVILGLEGERRIAGPFWLGAWVQAGSPVQAFQLQNVAFGAKLSIEFP